ncbi:hypothetical protein MCUN1_000729 [Malassezia cuniculi]|uniref:Tricalbin-1 n=1 Tax=Malassezia cuniculi TaxID=948313 RepID=A0AAF0ENK6_9BASI|nr:hypothetical protein MCUN1_000729 [Malassezia cuniculi]
MVSMSHLFHKDDKEVDPDEEVDQMNAELEAAGANPLDFGEDDSPEQKARKANKAKERLKPKGELREKQEQQKAEEEAKINRAIGVDAAHRKIRPNVSLKDLDTASRKRGQLSDGTLLPGGFPFGQPSVNVPDWYTVGWIGRSRALQGLSGLDLDISEQRVMDSTIVSTFVSDAYYGYFWSDGAAIAGAVIFTYIFTRLGGRLAALIIVLVSCGTFYCASIRRTRARVRDDITRQLAARRMETEHESAMWINNFLSRFWIIYEPVLSAMVIENVDATLKENTPSFLDSMRLSTFTLGTKAPIVDFVRTIPDTEDDVILMDWKFSFTPNDIEDLTVRQASRRINPRVVLSVRVGKGMVGAGLPILVEDMSFVGHIRIRMQLISNFPHVRMLDVSFMEPPSIDFVLKPIGGKTLGLDVASLPGLSGFIHNQIHAALGPMMYHPNQFSLNLEDMMSGTPLDSAIGVLKVVVLGAKNLENVQFTSEPPSAYVTLAVNDADAIEKTRIRKKNVSPVFRETKYLLLKDIQGILTLGVYNSNAPLPDMQLGMATFALQSLEERPDPGLIDAPVLYHGMQRGSLQYALTYFPVMKPEVAEDGVELPMPETNAGIMHFTLHQAKALEKNTIVPGEMSPKARVRLNGRVIKESATQRDTNEPVFEEVSEFLVMDRIGSVVTVEIIDDREEVDRMVIGTVNVRVDDLVQARSRKQDWFPIPRTSEGKVRMSVFWKPLVMAGSINGSASYRPPIGTAKFWIRGAEDVKNVEALMGGKSDPYALLRVNNVRVSGTTVVPDELDPVWNQVIYAPVHSINQSITLEVMDYQNSSADRSLGACEVRISELAEENVENRIVPYIGNGRRAHSEPLKQRSGQTKGTIDFEVEFLPAMNIQGSDFAEENREREASERRERGAAAQGDVAGEQPEEFGAAAGGAEADNDPIDGEVEEGDEENDFGGAQVSVEELLATPSGVIAFNLIDADIPVSRAQLEVAFDDAAWPALVTERRKGRDYKWDEVGEAVIRELDVSTVCMRIRIGMKDDDVIAEYMASTKDLLRSSIQGPTEITFTPVGNQAKLNIPRMDMPDMPNMPHMPEMPQDLASAGKMPVQMLTKGVTSVGKGASAVGGGVVNTVGGATGMSMPMEYKVRLSCRYIPLDVHLEPIESVVNQGILSIEVVSASGLRSADPNGKSDPFVIFTINGKKCGRSKTVKRTLDPVWNDPLEEVIIRSRLTHEHKFIVYDWDQVGDNDTLGQVTVNLAEIEPYETVERTYELGGKGAEPGSTLTVRYVFIPQYADNRTGKGGVMAANIANNVIGGIGKGVTGIGKGVGGIGKGVGGLGMDVGRSVRNVFQSKESRQSAENLEQSYDTNEDAGGDTLTHTTSNSDGPTGGKHSRSRLRNPFRRQ